MSDTLSLKDHLDKIEIKIDKLDSRVDNVDVTLAKQAVQLEHHIKRTELAEENITLVRGDIKPLQKHVDQVHTVLKIIGLLSSIAAVVSAVIKVLEYIHGIH